MAVTVTMQDLHFNSFPLIYCSGLCPVQIWSSYDGITKFLLPMLPFSRLSGSAFTRFIAPPERLFDDGGLESEVLQMIADERQPCLHGGLLVERSNRKSRLSRLGIHICLTVLILVTAINRVHRIEQEKTVYVKHFIVSLDLRSSYPLNLLRGRLHHRRPHNVQEFKRSRGHPETSLAQSGMDYAEHLLRLLISMSFLFRPLWSSDVDHLNQMAKEPQ
ncbi:uncharacterized protein BJ212DRAFT_206711 [Suillus subaureus]|uniref:Uncharacterized protein n=1 Tax=Suillus subaureus TaxID=48587 RepID=A0A9P7EB20_9AGAM|nr:uncharacterized protein BJ212DRAFT_206711 [Suillus subaureus]KAG1815991.1 hypothetical protein BJ212DRAFT_206711 [Suillus subaureus]